MPTRKPPKVSVGTQPMVALSAPNSAAIAPSIGVW